MDSFAVLRIPSRWYRRRFGIGFVFAARLFATFLAWLLVAQIAHAQSPWEVTVTPTLNPLPIGLCGAVQITVHDASATDTPRNPLGARLSLADFDMTVTAPGTRSVAGQQIDASHWSVCACSGATVGAVATITASYPAQSLPSAARVPGVAFTNTATFVIGTAKGESPPACNATPKKPEPTGASPPASAQTAPTPAQAPSSSAPIVPTSPAPTATTSQAATATTNSAPAASISPSQLPSLPEPPAPPVEIPAFPESTADWAALQDSMGASGWSKLQKILNEILNMAPDAEDDKAPPGSLDLPGAGRNHAMAVAEFKAMLPVLRHPRCINCHMDITYFDDARPEYLAQATHKGGDINENAPDASDRLGGPDIKLTPCNDCHTKAPHEWESSGPDWTGLDDYQMCQKLKHAAFNGDVLLDHLREDVLVKLAFEGRRAMEDVTPEPPPLTHAEFLRTTTAWINRMDAMQQWPRALSEGCPRTDKWSGAIEYTQTEVSKIGRFESHGAVHIVGGLAQWSALAARRDDHSAKNCVSVFSASASGEGEMQLVTIDHTSETPVAGFDMSNFTAKPAAARPEGYVALTIFPGIYSLAIELPMRGSGSSQGGGPACPGYKSVVEAFDITISDGAGGKFDPDNPDELSGTRTFAPFPGATITMKWQFMRQNEDRNR